MINPFPHIFATLKASTYFATTLSGFEDDGGNFKVFPDNEAPTDETQFITVEFQPNEEDRNTLWNNVQAIFHCYGKETDRDALYAHAKAIRDVFRNAASFTAVGSADALGFALLGPAVTSTGHDPVTDNIVVSVALTFGFLENT